MKEHVQHAALQASASVGPSGQFEILAISAGEGNGWQFSAETLRASLSLWEGASCFLDHSWQHRSVRDLAGACCEPQFDDVRQGIRLKLRPMGPGAALLNDLGRQMLSEDGRAHPKIGFSADILFTASGREVKQILKVNSLDLVFDPARGGAFLSAPESTHSQGGMQTMDSKQSMENHEVQTPHTARTALQAEPAPIASEAAQELEQARQMRVQMCAYLLDSALSAAHLPEPAARRVRERFAGRSFEPQELQSAVEDARRLVSELTASQTVRGPRISEMFSAEDQLGAAVHDLLGAERPAEWKNVQPARLSGIRELYLLMTGDTGFRGGYDAAQAQFATSADLPGLLKNALNKLVVDRWQELGRAGYRWWEPVVSVEHFTSLQPVSGVLVGEVTLLPQVSEGAAYSELGVDDSAESGSWGKYGGYVGLTLEMFERDETHKLRQYPRKLASAGLRRISSLVSAVFTANSGAGPAMSDGYNVFDATHHANLGTDELSAEAWEAASQAIYEQQMLVKSGGTAPRLALDARYLLVPRGLRLAGMQILYPQWEHQAQIFSENMQRGEMGDVITVPEWSDASDWAAVADPRLAPAVIVAERFGLLPEIFIADNQLSGALFTNDEIRIKARHWISVFVADHRPLYKSNVADS